MAYYLRISRKDNHQVADQTTERERARRQRAGDVIEMLPGDWVFGPAEFLTDHYGMVRVNDLAPSPAIQAVIDGRSNVDGAHWNGAFYIQMTVWLPSLAPPQRAAFNTAADQSEILTLANSTSLEAAIGTRPAIT